MNTLYSDFDISFELNENGDIKRLNDEECIRQSIKNSINMNSYDIPFNSFYATNLKKYLFEHPNKIIESEMISKIKDVLLLDPRIRNPDAKVTYSSDFQYCYIDITVYIIILDKTITEKIIAERVR